MTEQRKTAYRYLLYWATLDIRPVRCLVPRGWRAWSPLHWKRHADYIRRAGTIADWLHNLAQHSALDFRRFDEVWFWRTFEWACRECPETGLEHYRERFEQYATTAPSQNDGSLDSEVPRPGIADIPTP